MFRWLVNYFIYIANIWTITFNYLFRWAPIWYVMMQDLWSVLSVKKVLITTLSILKLKIMNCFHPKILTLSTLSTLSYFIYNRLEASKFAWSRHFTSWVGSATVHGSWECPCWPRSFHFNRSLLTISSRPTSLDVENQGAAGKTCK